MPSVGYIQQLQKVFAHLKRNGGANRPAGCLQVELIDADDLTNWFVQLSFQKVSARPSGRGNQHPGDEKRAEEAVAGPADVFHSSEGEAGDAEDLIVNLRLRFLEASDDESASGPSSHPLRRSHDSASASRMPLVFVHSPRLIAPFIHFGALCAWELMSQSNWSLTPLNMELLLIALHETLNPFAPGSSVQVLADGIGQGAMGEASASETNRYTEEEHLDGIRYIRRAHPHLFRAAAPASSPDTRRATTAEEKDGDGDGESDGDADAASAEHERLTTAPALSSFLQNGLWRHTPSRATPGADSTHACCTATVDEAAIVESLNTLAKQETAASVGSCSSSSPSLPSCSLIALAPSTLCRLSSLAYCALCPPPRREPQHVVTVYMPHFFPPRQGDRLSFRLSGATLPSAAAASPPAPRRLALVLRQAPSSDAQAATSAKVDRLTTTRDRAMDAAAWHDPLSSRVGTCVVREGCSLTLRNLAVYGHLRVLGRLTLVNCTFTGSLVAERAARVTLRGCDVTLAVQDRLLLPCPPVLSPAHPTPSASNNDRPPHDNDNEESDLSRDIRTTRLEGVLALDSSVVEILDGCLVSRAVPFFSPVLPRPPSSESLSCPMRGTTMESEGEATGRAAHRRRLTRRPRFSLRHEKTLQEQEGERLSPLRALLLVTNHARLRVSDSAVTPRQPATCQYTIIAENDALVDVCGAVVAAGQSSAITLQGCRGHCERVLVTSAAALHLVWHRKLHGLDSAAPNVRSNTGDELIAEEERRLFTPPGPPDLAESRKSTGINVELGGVVTARYCLVQFVYFGYSAIAQSVASFHGCHAQDVINGFTIDASTAHLGRCSAEVAHVALFVLHKAKCVLLSEEGDGGSVDGGGGTATPPDSVNSTKGAADDLQGRAAPQTRPPVERRAGRGHGARCRLIKELSSDDAAARFAAPQDAVHTFLTACAAAERGEGEQVDEGGGGQLPRTEGNSLAFSLLSRTRSPQQPCGLSHVTAVAIATAQSYLTAATAAANGLSPLLHPFCVFVGGALGLELRDAVVEASGAVFACPTDAAVLALSKSELKCTQVIAWQPRCTKQQVEVESTAAAEVVGTDKATSPTGGAEEKRGPDSDEGGLDDDLPAAHRTAPPQQQQSSSSSSAARTVTSSYGFSLKDGVRLKASGCLVMGFTYALFLAQGSVGDVEASMAGGCLFGFVASTQSRLAASFCGVTATAGAVSAMDGATVRLVGEPHAMVEGEPTSDPPQATQADGTTAPTASSTVAAGAVGGPPRVICGGCYLSVYRAGVTAVEASARSTLHCTGVVILRGDRNGFRVCENSSARLAHCLVDVSPYDAARFILKGRPPPLTNTNWSLHRELLLGDGACFDSSSGATLPAIANTADIATCAVWVGAGGVCEAVEVEVRFAACAFLASGPESALCVRRSRIRRVMTGVHVEDGAAAAVVRCRADATFGLVLLPHARCAVVNGRFTAREVGFDNTGGLLRILGHVKLFGSAQVGVRVDDEGCLEVLDSAATSLPEAPRRQAGIFQGTQLPLGDGGEEAAADGVATRLEVRLHNSPSHCTEPLPATLPSADEAEKDEEDARSPLSLSLPNAAPSSTRSPTSVAPAKRNELPVCLLLKGNATATVHNSLFSSQAATTAAEGTIDGSDSAVAYGLRAMGGATASLTRCRFDADCFREACVRVGAGAHVSLAACEVMGRSCRDPTASASGNGSGAIGAGPRAGGTWYALEIHRGATCAVTGAPGTEAPAISPPLRRHPIIAAEAASGLLGVRGARALWALGRVAVTNAVRLLSQLLRFPRLLPAAPSRRESTASAQKHCATREADRGTEAATAPAPWGSRRFPPPEQWLVSWMQTCLSPLSSQPPSSPSACTSSVAHAAAHLSHLRGRSLVTGTLTIECTLSSHCRCEDGEERGDGSHCAAPVAHARRTAPSVQFDVAKEGHFRASRCLFLVGPQPRAATPDRASISISSSDGGGGCGGVPLIFARHPGTTVDLTACVICPQQPTAPPPAPPATASHLQAFCLLRVGDGAKAKLTLLTSARCPSEAVWPTPADTVSSCAKAAAAAAACLPLAVHAVCPGAQLSLDACVLHAVLLLPPPTASPSPSPSRPRTRDEEAASPAEPATRISGEPSGLHISHCLFLSSRDAAVQGVHPGDRARTAGATAVEHCCSAPPGAPLQRSPSALFR